MGFDPRTCKGAVGWIEDPVPRSPDWGVIYGGYAPHGLYICIGCRRNFTLADLNTWCPRCGKPVCNDCKERIDRPHEIMIYNGISA